MNVFTKVVLFTDYEGRARFREESIPLDEGTPQSMLSKVLPANGYQLRESPVGFRSDWHCTPQPQWVFILDGEMEIGFARGEALGERQGIAGLDQHMEPPALDLRAFAGVNVCDLGHLVHGSLGSCWLRRTLHGFVGPETFGNR